jgi:DNA-directed RNA polymerase specialized sigma24 family protein
MPEIAEALGAPLNTLYSRLRIGRQRFADAVRAAAARGTRK